MKSPEEAVLVSEGQVTKPERPPEVEDIGEYDPEDVAAWCQRQRWFTTGPWDTEFHERRFHPKVLALYKVDRARELERERREAAQRAESERRAAESREASARWAAHKQLMRDMRKWGPENGYFVGTRGRIPRKVIEAYKEAKGL
jgi:hypothetical protein